MMERTRPRLALAVSAGSDLPELCAHYLLEYCDKIRLACEGLEDPDLWARSTRGANSIANLLLHLRGNLSQWILASLAGWDFVRDRAAEFAADHTESGPALLEGLRGTVEDCRRAIAGLDQSTLDGRFRVQGYSVTGLGALVHAVEHMSYHTGQIVSMAKEVRLRSGRGFEFYPHLSPVSDTSAGVRSSGEEE